MREHAAEGPAPEATEDVVTTLAPPAPLSAPPLTVQGLLGIQRHAGNRAAAALVARQPTATKDGTLAMGATGSAVTALQMHLNMVDEVKTELVTDGIYGPITTSAVRQFQSAHPPLKATGAADAETQAALAEALKEDQNQEDIGRKLFALGGRSYERGKYGHAYAFFTRAGELADRPGITFSRAQALRRLGGRREEAIALYEQYLARGDGTRKADAEAALKELRAPEATGDEDKDNATAKGIFNKGGALYEKGDYGHAYDEFTRASELADRPGILFSRAQALRRLGGREAEAMALYQQYIDLGEGSRLEDAKQMLELLQTHGAAP
jgi:peptidoglycan hydrolase-like protein with peptidoglycan-binding domain